MNRTEYRKALKAHLQKLACQRLQATRTSATHMDIDAKQLSGGEWFLESVKCRITENTHRVEWSDDAGKVVLIPIKVMYSASWDGMNFAIEETGRVER